MFKNERREILNMLERATKCNTGDGGGVESSDTSDELSARAMRFKNRSLSHDHKTIPQLLAEAQSSFHLERIEELLEMDEGVESSPDLYSVTRFVEFEMKASKYAMHCKYPLVFTPGKGIL